VPHRNSRPQSLRSGVEQDGTLLNHAWLTQPLCDQNGNEDTEEETGEDTQRCGEAER
jgi:hypothetical protein